MKEYSQKTTLCSVEQKINVSTELSSLLFSSNYITRKGIDNMHISSKKKISNCKGRNFSMEILEWIRERTLSSVWLPDIWTPGVYYMHICCWCLTGVSFLWRHKTPEADHAGSEEMFLGPHFLLQATLPSLESRTEGRRQTTWLLETQYQGFTFCGSKGQAKKKTAGDFISKKKRCKDRERAESIQGSVEQWDNYHI